jgi:hypothetical protein
MMMSPVSPNDDLLISMRRITPRVVFADYLPAEIYEDFVHICLALSAGDLSAWKGHSPRRRADVS